jgi:hypothetical protein
MARKGYFYLDCFYTILLMVNERNPNIPLPPPPPGPKKIELSSFTPTPEAQNHESVELNDVEQVLFKNSVEYGNLKPEEAQMTPELRGILKNFREDRLFAVQVYALSGGEDGNTGGSTYDTSVIKLNPTSIYDDINPQAVEGTAIRYKRPLGIAESMAFTPVTKRDKKIVEKVIRPDSFWRKGIKESTVEYGQPRSARFSEAVPNASSKVANDQLIRVTYHASDPRDPKRYVNPIAADVRWRKTQHKIDKTGRIAQPVPFSADPADNINAHMEDILHMRQLSPEQLAGTNEGHGSAVSIRRDGQIAISVMLPKSRAVELWKYFQQHPEHVRPFFIAGAEDLMPLHLPPPYKAWDAELPKRPVLFREFNNERKEVAPPTIKNSK